MMKLKTLVIAALLVAATACAHGSANGSAKKEEEKPKEPSADSVEAIRKRAAFELGCATDQLQVSVIEAGDMWRPWTFGVAGCDKRATYLYRMGTIINNSQMPK